MAWCTEASKEAVIESIDALAVVGDYLRLEKKSGRYWGLCPFHHEKTPSFTVNPDRKSYYCFGCQKGGDMLNFVMEMDKLTFPEALEAMSKRFGVPLVYEGGTGEGYDAKRDEKKEELAELYRRVTLSFHHILMKTDGGEKAKQYLLGRGITAETIEKFQLGFAPADRSWLYHFLGGKGFSAEFLAGSGLFSRKYPQSAFFSNRLMFPIADRTGRIAAFGGRILEGEGPKYLNSAESDSFKKGKTLFALNLALDEIKRSKAVYIAEGYMDVIALHQGGISNTIAPLGTAFTDDQAKLLHRWAERAFLMLDNDEAGQNAAVKAILCCRRNGLDCVVVDSASFFKEKEAIPKDPAEILQKFGAEALKNSVGNCILDVEFMISRARTLRDRSRSVAFMFPYLDALDSEVTREESVRTIADAFGVEWRAVWEDYTRQKERNAGRAVYGNDRKAESEGLGAGYGVSGQNAGAAGKTVVAGYELLLLGAVFVNPALFRGLRSEFSEDDLDESGARELYIILEEWFRERGSSGGGEKPEELLERIQDGNLRDFILRQESLGTFAHSEQLVAGGINRIKIKVLEKKRRELIRKLRNTSPEGLSQQERQADLLAEKIHIDSELIVLKGLRAGGVKTASTEGVVTE